MEREKDEVVQRKTQLKPRYWFSVPSAQISVSSGDTGGGGAGGGTEGGGLGGGGDGGGDGGRCWV